MAQNKSSNRGNNNNGRRGNQGGKGGRERSSGNKQGENSSGR